MVGHLFQGRCESIIVEKNTHFLEPCRYIVLNPVRARIVQQHGSGDGAATWRPQGTIQGLTPYSARADLLNDDDTLSFVR